MVTQCVASGFLNMYVTPLFSRSAISSAASSNPRTQTNVSVHQWTLANSPECFVRPTSFVPERWLSPEAPEFASDRRSASQPFSLGPRSCIGKNLAYAEMRLILARLLWNFDIAVPNEGQKVMSWASQKTYVLVEKQPFEIRLKYVGE